MSVLKMCESGSRGNSIRQKMFKIQAGTDFTSFSTGIKIKVFRKNAEYIYFLQKIRNNSKEA